MLKESGKGSSVFVVLLYAAFKSGFFNSFVHHFCFFVEKIETVVNEKLTPPSPSFIFLKFQLIKTRGLAGVVLPPVL